MRRILTYLRDGGWMLLLICALLLAMCVGCTRTVYIPTESVRTELRADTLRQIQLQHDSVYRLDSIYIKGDTIYKERVRYRYSLRTDTFYKTRIDTVYQSHEITKMVESANPLLGRHSWLLLVLSIVFLILAFRLMR